MRPLSFGSSSSCLGVAEHRVVLDLAPKFHPPPRSNKKPRRRSTASCVTIGQYSGPSCEGLGCVASSDTSCISCRLISKKQAHFFKVTAPSCSLSHSSISRFHKMTNLGPLTTTLTPLEGCLQTIYGQIFTDTTTHKYHSLGRSETSDCYPSDFQVKSDAYYSPGLCPSGWKSACGSVEVLGTAAETRAKCCPSGYSCQVFRGQPVAWSTLSCYSLAMTPVELLVPFVDNVSAFQIASRRSLSCYFYGGWELTPSAQVGVRDDDTRQYPDQCRSDQYQVAED